MLSHMMMEGAAAMGLSMAPAQAEQFEVYHSMLLSANARMNLTRVPEDLREAADRNYLDSIAPLSCGFPEVARAVDVGSGAGFPGIPLAIMLPEVHFVLIDSLGKRINFLKDVICALGLNAEALHLRAEDAGRRPELRAGFDLAMARAVAPMNLLCEYLLPLIREGGWMMALKGPALDEEMGQAAYALETLGGEAVRVDALEIPGRDWDHRLAWIRKVRATPDRYPRKAGLPEKKPLAAK